MALSSSLPIVLTHTWSTFFLSGAIQARCLPSGEICGLVRSGLPKRISRGIRGGGSAWLGMDAPRRQSTARERIPGPQGPRGVGDVAFIIGEAPSVEESGGL